MKQYSVPTRFLWLASLAVTLLGFAIRLHHLAGDSLWIDEMLTLDVVKGGSAAIFSQNDHPPLFYLITSPFVHIFGDSEFALRLSPFIAGVLALPLLSLFGRQIGRPEAGVWATLLLALSPFHLRYSQEARHYTWLMTFTLITFILLYRALKRPTWRTWLAFILATVLNLYTHYGAFVVLAVQSLIIAGWLLTQWWQRHYRVTRYPLTAAGIILILYLPWLPRVQLAFDRNLGADIVDNNRQVTPLLGWLTTTFTAFNPSQPYLLPLLLGIAFIGLLFWGRQRQWLGEGMVLAGLVLPLLLITLFDVARIPRPRYVIYMLPLYLLFVGTGLVALLRPLQRRHAGAWAGAVTVITGGLLATYVPLITREYIFVLNDWRTVLDYLGQEAQAQDVVIEMSLNYPSGYNVVSASLPYYTAKWPTQYQPIHGNSVNLDEALALAQSDRPVFGVVMNWGQPFQFADSTMEIQPVQKDIYVLHDTTQTGNTLSRAIDFYEQIIPYADAPAPQCFLQHDVAVLATADQQWQTAVQAYTQAVSQCPDLADNQEVPISEIYHHLMAQYLANGKVTSARQTAFKILQQLNAQDGPALKVLQVENLLQRYRQGEASVKTNGAPEPVHMAQFDMPNSAEGEDVLFTHPPAAVSYELDLPDEATALYFRMGMAPESWHWGGDGSTFIITVQENNEAPVELFREYVSNEPEDQIWHDAIVPLADYAGETVTITLQTDSGPAGDNTGDWAGWDTLRLIWAASS